MPMYGLAGLPHPQIPPPPREADAAAAAFIASSIGTALWHGPRLLARLLPSIPDALDVCEQLNFDEASPGPHVTVRPRKPIMGAVMGELFNEVAGEPAKPATARSIGARATAVIWAIDYLIDDFGMRPERRVEILEQMKESITLGKVHIFPETSQLGNCSIMLRGLWRTMQRAPDGARFTQMFGDLADVAIDQIQQPASLDMAVRLGGATAAVIGVIPYCWADLPVRYLETSRAVGAYIQIFDDLLDRERDRAHGIHTFATESDDVETTTAQAVETAQTLIDQANSVLLPKERWVLRCILAGASLGSRQLWAYRKQAPLPSVPALDDMTE